MSASAETIAIENLIYLPDLPSAVVGRYSKKHSTLYSKIRKTGLDVVSFHAMWLGKPLKRRRLEFLFSIWQYGRLPLTLYIANVKGICCEVPANTKPKEAYVAWNEYYKAACRAAKTLMPEDG